ncbi:hypothetical protein ACEWY4_004058 [Coilia grayii]|uniref:Uncharacterized protein n=1 Tax=Coilia grayii TaxID=363190 RepID=A0ABD1KKN2_9TELE
MANPFPRLGLRPVVCAAGLTATAVGAVFLLYRRPRQTAEIGTQTDWERAEVATQAGWETANAASQVLLETAEAATQVGLEVADAGTQAKWETAEAGVLVQWPTAEAGVQAVRETAVTATQAVWETVEADTQWDWADGNSITKCVTVMCVFLNMYFCNAKLQMEVQTQHRGTTATTWSTLFSLGPLMVGSKLCFGEAVEGPVRTQFQFLTNETFVVDAEGNPDTLARTDIATFIERRCGDLVHGVSNLKQEFRCLTDLDGVQVIQVTKVCKQVKLAADGSVRSRERTEVTYIPASTIPNPSPAGPGGDASAHPGPDAPASAGADNTAHPGPDAPPSAGADTTATPGANTTVAPDEDASASAGPDTSATPDTNAYASPGSGFNFLQSSGLGDFPARLTALRQAFTILLRHDQQCNYITVAVRVILSNLATLNGKDAHLFEQAFDTLLAYVQNPHNALSIQDELLEAGIHYVNIIDVVFELVLFGVLVEARTQLIPRVQGGFLDQLLAVIYSFLPCTAWSASAYRYWDMLQADVLGFLYEIFSLDLTTYSRLQALADGLFSSLEHHVDQLLSRLPT